MWETGEESGCKLHPSKVYVCYHHHTVTNEGVRKYGEIQRQDAYIEHRSNGTPAVESARMAGYTGRKARTPRKLIETAELRARMQESLIRKRVTLDVIAGRVSDALSANYVDTSKLDGPIESNVPDQRIRLKAVESATKLWGLGESSKSDAGGAAFKLELSGPLAERFMQHLQEKG